MTLVIGKHEVYALTKGNRSLALTKVADFPGDGVVCAASGSKVILYYVPTDAPQVVMQMTVEGGARKEMAKLPSAAKKMHFYRNKIYCAMANSTCIACVDPLNLSVDLLDTHHTVVDFEPADHGFVLEDDVGILYGYHFNYGAAKVRGTAHAQLLGHYKRFGVAMTAGDADALWMATERGEIVQTAPAISGVMGDFIAVSDNVFVYKKASHTIETADGVCQCGVPPSVVHDGLVILSPVPELENEDACTLCFCEFDGQGDGITLDCGHRFHKDCVMEWVARWDEFKAKGTHIAFTNAVCPGGCKNLTRHPLLGSVSESIRNMCHSVAAQSKKVLESKAATKIEEDLLFYVCSKCGDPFYGGEKVCFRTQGGEPKKDPADLVCEKCQTDFRCPTHGRDLVVYKCFYCCNPATDRSFGNRYLCDRCGVRWTSTAEPDVIPCPGDADCPLGGHHHRESAFPIGCAACMKPDAIDYSRIVPALATSPSSTNGGHGVADAY